MWIVDPQRSAVDIDVADKDDLSVAGQPVARQRVNAHDRRLFGSRRSHTLLFRRRRRITNRPIAELELSVRARNCLDGANIQTLRDLVSLSENEVMNLKNLGKTSLTEIKTKLAERGLSLGMQV